MHDDFEFRPILFLSEPPMLAWLILLLWSRLASPGAEPHREISSVSAAAGPARRWLTFRRP